MNKLTEGERRKIRGISCNIKIFDDLDYIDPDLFESVVKGFGVVQNSGLIIKWAPYEK